jgi:hypothetical protein
MDLTPFMPDCGHTVTPTPGRVGTGTATDPKTGRTMCYPCAEASERDAIKTADSHTGYVSDDGKQFATWTGGELGKITSIVRGARQYGKDGPYRMRTVYVTTPDGARWFGRGSDDVDLITVHRLKTKGN